MELILKGDLVRHVDEWNMWCSIIVIFVGGWWLVDLCLFTGTIAFMFVPTSKLLFMHLLFDVRIKLYITWGGVDCQFATS